MKNVGDEARADELEVLNFEIMGKLRENYKRTMHPKREPPEGM